MKRTNEKPNIAKYFKEDNFVKQDIYASKEKYIPVYINVELYESIFKEKYEEDKAFAKISELFSITLNKNNSTNELIGIGYSDKQKDPLGISLSGNLGSGRAYFYGKHFNIKGDKTSLATSPNEKYSNGKFALPSAIKEAIISNIISKELSIPTFETLAILDTTDTYEYSSQYLDSNNKIIENKFILPNAIEIRINKDNELYRVSNSFINKDKLTYEELIDITDKFAKIEAEKFLKRYLHGSWSTGNITQNANLIDFDTFSFVKGRNPLYSNTNNYKTNYFGYEILGSKKILQSLFDNSLKNNTKYKFSEIEKETDTKYNKYLREEFCNIIGLDNKKYYLKYKNIIDNLFNLFIVLSRQFIPNYYALNVLDKDSDVTYIYDFSNFFQKYLVGKDKNKNNILYGVDLLLNDTEVIEYKKIGPIKTKIKNFFKDNIIKNPYNAKILASAINFVNNYDQLFTEIAQIESLEQIKIKQYVLNMNRDYLYEYDLFYGCITKQYTDNKISNKTLNIIINNLIKTNIRKVNSKQKEYNCKLKINKEYLSYITFTNKEYYYVIVPYKELNIRFAKLYIEDEEYMFHHTEEGTLVSDKITYNNLIELDKNHTIFINGKKNDKNI